MKNSILITLFLCVTQVIFSAQEAKRDHIENSYQEDYQENYSEDFVNNEKEKLTQELEELYNGIINDVGWSTIDSDVWHKNSSKMQNLIIAGADVGPTNKRRRRSLLAVACGCNDAAFVQCILDHRASPNAMDDTKKTPLSCARSAKVAKLLLNAKADVFHKDWHGGAELHRVAESMECPLDVLELISNVTMDAGSLPLNVALNTPLHNWLCHSASRYPEKSILPKSAQFLWLHPQQLTMKNWCGVIPYSGTPSYYPDYLSAFDPINKEVIRARAVFDELQNKEIKERIIIIERYLPVSDIAKIISDFSGLPLFLSLREFLRKNDNEGINYPALALALNNYSKA